MQDKWQGSGRFEMATLGGGCFWCLDPVFSALIGVERVVVGYAGGDKPDPTYKQVCEGTTGHAEVIQITFDPALVTYRSLLEVFFSVHDPTTLNRQGADVGTQYRSIILTHDEDQAAAAHALIEEIEGEGIWSSPVVTQVKPLQAFYPAEDYHQRYFENNPGAGYCRAVIAPKLSKFRKTHAASLKPSRSVN